MSTHMTTVFQHQRALMVKNLRPGLTECGKIKIGVKGNLIKSKQGNEFQPPQKLDHFVVTTLQRGQDGNFLRDRDLHERFGEKPTEIPVRLLFDDPWLNFQTIYTAFKGATRFCTGDGETAQRLQQDGTLKERPCPCQLLDPAYQGKDKCKINGTLSVMIEGATVVGGVWKLRTTSINTCQGIASSLAFILSVTGGKLAGIPLMLTVRPKAATTPTGTSTTVYVVGIEFRGSIEDLRDYAHRQAVADATHGERMKHVEDYARKLLSAPVVNEAEDEDVRDEFYPEAAADAHDAHLVQTEGPTAADRRAAMMRGDDEPAMVAVYSDEGEEVMLQAGEVEQYLRNKAPVAAGLPEEELRGFIDGNREHLERYGLMLPQSPSEPRQATTEPEASPAGAQAEAEHEGNSAPAPNGNGKTVTITIDGREISGPAAEVLPLLAKAFETVLVVDDLLDLIGQNSDVLRRSAKAREWSQQARARLDMPADPMADLDDLDGLPPDKSAKGKGQGVREGRLV